MTEPTTIAVMAIIDTMTVGSLKDGCDNSWRQKGREFHLLKANSHLAQAMRIEAGIDDESECHLSKAITRLAMAMCCDRL